MLPKADFQKVVIMRTRTPWNYTVTWKSKLIWRKVKSIVFVKGAVSFILNSWNSTDTLVELDDKGI